MPLPAKTPPPGRRKTKDYQLDFDIYYAKDRNEYVKTILDELEEYPSAAELEQMADYILYGHDEYYMNAIDSGEVLNPKRRYGNYRTKSEKNESLDALMEDPITAPATEASAQRAQDRSKYKVYAPTIKRSIYDEQGNLIEKGDDFDWEGNLVQPMRDLWECIDHWTDLYEQYTGKKPPTEYVQTHPLSKYQVWKMNHMIIDMRRDQYYIKDTYNPTVNSFSFAAPPHTNYDFNQDTGYWLDEQEWCRRRRTDPKASAQPLLQNVPRNEDGQCYWYISHNSIDYENPKHIAALIDNYVALLKRSYDKLNSPTRMLCFDLEALVDKANLTDVEYFVFTQKIARKNNFGIMAALAEEGVEYTEGTFRHLYKDVIPKKIATAAKICRLESEVVQGKLGTKACSKCRRILPADTMFFCRSREKPSGFCSQCKQCQSETRRRRIAKQGGNTL